jgi:hypothetical protein
VVEEWAALGLNSLQISPARGGPGASCHTKIAVAEAMARSCMASAFALNNIQSSVTQWSGRDHPRRLHGAIDNSPGGTSLHCWCHRRFRVPSGPRRRSA